MEEIKRNVKSLLIDYIGKALGKQEQTEIYKKMRDMVSKTPYEYDFATVYKACVICDLKTEYHNSKFEDWSILTIFVTEDERMEGMVAVAKREYENTVKNLPALKTELEELKNRVSSIENTVKQLELFLEKDKVLFENEE